MSSKCKITHLFHSSFLIETENHTLVFDFFDYTSHYIIKSRKILTSDFFINKDNIFVFVSHKHKDHFDPKIFEWQEANPNINYILSSDVEVDTSLNSHYFMEKYEEVEKGNVKISTFGSTDLGVSFLVEVDGLTIFHAGDLNWWHWKNDKSEVQLKEESDFKYEIDKLKGKEIDVAFIPADPRLEEYYYLSSEYFINTIQPKMLVPMHFGDKYYVAKKLYKKLQHLGTDIAVITEKSKEFWFSK